MGMESFFVMALPKGIAHQKDNFGVNFYEGESTVTESQLEKILLLRDCKKLEATSITEYHFLGKYLLKPAIKAATVINIVIEACLWYLENDLSTLSKLLDLFIDEGWRIFHPALGYLEHEQSDFAHSLLSFYKKKTNEFLTKYSSIFEAGNSLPGKYFYEKIGVR